MPILAESASSRKSVVFTLSSCSRLDWPFKSFPACFNHQWLEDSKSCAPVIATIDVTPSANSSFVHASANAKILEYPLLLNLPGAWCTCQFTLIPKCMWWYSLTAHASSYALLRLHLWMGGDRLVHLMGMLIYSKKYMSYCNIVHTKLACGWCSLSANASSNNKFCTSSQIGLILSFREPHHVGTATFSWSYLRGSVDSSWS